MKKISKWAQRHPLAARLIITTSHLLIIANGLLSSLFLFLNDWQHASYTVYLLMFSFALLYIFYPKRGQKTGLFKYSYRAQKTHDFGLVILGFLMISIGSNNWLAQNISNNSIASPTATFIVHEHEKPSKRQFKRELRKELRALKKEFKKRKDREGTLVIRILLTLLVLMAAVALAYLIAILSCKLSCSGSSGLAALLTVVGTIGIVALGISAIHKIWLNNSRYRSEKD